MLSGTLANIAVKVFGDDLPTLRALAKQINAAIAGVPGVVDLSIEQQTDIPLMRVRVNAAAAARYGLPAGQVAQSIQTAYAGNEVGQVLEGQVGFPLVVRYRGSLAGPDTVARTQIDTPMGAKIPLSAMADIGQDRGPNFIMREGVQRRIVVQCNVAGRDLRGVVNDIQRNIAASVQLPQGYRIEYGGQFQSEAEATRRLSILGIIVVAAILLILATAFGSVRSALVIMLNLPLALAGGVAGVYFAGGVLSVASIIGFITVFGIATRNGIMLISHIRHLQETEGVTDLREAVLRGGLERVSPILMTALAAGLALIPVALGMGKPGSEIQAPMALVILCGLLSSTALNMVVVPAAFYRFARSA
jgi:Cu/Ag efflux pump CusA